MKGLYGLLLLSIFSFFSCSGNQRLLSFDQYGFLQHGSESVQPKGDIVISAKLLRPSDMYSFPQLFGFLQDSLSAEFRENAFVQKTYQRSLKSKNWEYILASPEYEKVLVAFHVKISNYTEHILHMKSARVYLIVDRKKAIPSLKNYKELADTVAAFEKKFIKNRKSNKKYRAYPEGLFPAILEQNKQQFELLTDLSKEILPGFSLTGLLIFPMKATDLKNTKLSFFDITTRTDAAGRPTEKSRFDFALRREPACMKYNGYTKRWDSCDSDIAVK